MPELAEVAYYARRWEPGIGEKIVAVDTQSRSRVFRSCDPSKLENGLIGQKLLRIQTHGKQMLFEFSGGQWLLIHLGMTGSLEAHPLAYSPAKHDHLVISTRKHALVFNDPRQFGSVQHGSEGAPELWKTLPPQPMDADFGLERLRSVLGKHPRAPLKALLLDQRYFPGIGNWMADEVMWQLKLHPETPAGSLTAKQSSALWKTLRKVCDVALKTIGVDWTDPPKTWLFTHRWDKARACPRCGTTLIKIDLRGRTACWCPQCQNSAPA